MKLTRSLLILLSVLCLLLAGCQSTTPDSETAMNNFQKKLEEGNWVLSNKDFLTITVSSRDQVTFEYDEDSYRGFTVMSVNDEAFQALISDNQLEAAAFLTEGQAIDAPKGDCRTTGSPMKLPKATSGIFSTTTPRSL